MLSDGRQQVMVALEIDDPWVLLLGDMLTEAAGSMHVVINLHRQECQMDICFQASHMHVGVH